MAKSKVNFLLLRGITREKSHWGVFLPRLKKNFPDSVIYCLDLPGVGTENQRLSPLSISGITDDIRARWKKDFAKSKLGDWVCVGHSLGGMVALDWQTRYPRDFVGCALINTSARGASSLWKRVELNALAEFIKIATCRNLDKREGLILNLVSNKLKNNKKIIQEWVAFATERPMHKLTPLRQFMAAAMFSVRPPTKIPLLFFYSTEDRLVHYSCSLDLAQKFDADFCEHKSAGHDIALDDPDWLVEKLETFTNKINSRV